MPTNFISEYIKIHENNVRELGEEDGNALFKYFTDTLLFITRMKLIQGELDLYEELYLKKIFPTTENYYTTKLKI